MIRRLGWAAATCALVCFVGCKKSDVAGLALSPLKGTVMRNGKPVGPNAQVTLAPDSGQDITITGLTDAQGHFEIHTSGADGRTRSGAPDGNYTVTVVTPGNESGVQGGFEQITLPNKIEVKAGMGHLKLELPGK